MGIFGPPDIKKLEAKKNIKGLIKALSSSDVEIRKSAAKALGYIGNSQAVEPLITALRDSHWQMQLDATIALGRIDSDWTKSEAARTAVPGLVEVLKDSDNHFRLTAAHILGEIGDWRAVESLITRLKDREFGVRKEAREALEKINQNLRESDEAKSAIPELLEMLDNTESDMREIAIEALGTIGDARTVDSLITLLNDDSKYIREIAAKALGQIGNKRAVEPLIKELKEGTVSVKAALDKIDSNWPKSEVAQSAAQEFEKVLSDSNWKVRSATGWALSIARDMRQAELITYEGSKELRDANNLALDPNKASEGIQQLQDMMIRFPDCSDPHCLLAQAMTKMGTIHEAEKVLLDAFPRVLRKSNVADSLGYLYFHKFNNLPKSGEWYSISIAAAGSDPKGMWAPYLYLGEFYSAYRFKQRARALHNAANSIRKNPVKFNIEWSHKLSNLMSNTTKKFMTSILDTIWNSIVEQRVTELKKMGIG